jgi:hypothetical protein
MNVTKTPVGEQPAPRRLTPEEKVLRAFFEAERLTSIPARQGKKLVILRWLADRFEPGREYPESEVNEILLRHHEDCAALRRYLVDFGFMTRDHGVYRRAD